MSDEQPPEPKKPLYRRLLPTSTAGKTAAVTSLVLLLVLIVVWVLRAFGPQSVKLAHAVSVPQMIVEVVLVILIPAVLYWGIRRWNQVVVGEFPDIDRAWESGIEALRAIGVDPRDYPIFLVLGSSGDETESGLMDALDTDLVIQGVPDTTSVNHALQWYMSSDAIYLFCPGASALSVLMGRWKSTLNRSGGRPMKLAPTSSSNSGSPAAGTSAAKTSDANGIDVASLKIQRGQSGAPSPSKPGPSTPGGSEPAAKAPPKIPAKVQSMPGAAGGGLQNATQPPAYLGTIQHMSMDPSPQENVQNAARRAASAFDMAPAAKAPANPNQGMEAPKLGQASGSTDMLRPAPKYEGTISSFDPNPAQTASSPSRPGTVSSASAPAAPAATPPRSSSEPAQGAPAASSGSAAIAASTARTDKRPTVGSAAQKPGGIRKVALPTSLDTSEQLPRLKYVCRLIKRVRRPMCGINGAVTLIPFELSQVGSLQLSAIAQSTRSDLETVQETLGVRSPVTAILVGLEHEKGFTELVRRLQAGLLSRRLGGRFDLRSRPSPEELNTHSDRLCDAFEDWVYRLFSRDDGLAMQRGNRKLYALMCKIRHELKPRLRIVLGQAFGCESSDEKNSSSDDDSLLFSGCYFVANGALTGQPAFVKGVLKDKLIEEQSKVEWTPKARAIHRLFVSFSLVGWLVALAIAGLLLFLLMR